MTFVAGEFGQILLCECHRPCPALETITRSPGLLVKRPIHSEDFGKTVSRKCQCHAEVRVCNQVRKTLFSGIEESFRGFNSPVLGWAYVVHD